MTARTFRQTFSWWKQSVPSQIQLQTLRAVRININHRLFFFFQETHRGWDWLLELNAQLVAVQVKQEAFTFLIKK